MWSYEVFEDENIPFRTYHWHGFNTVFVYDNGVEIGNFTIMNNTRENVISAVEAHSFISQHNAKFE